MGVTQQRGHLAFREVDKLPRWHLAHPGIKGAILVSQEGDKLAIRRDVRVQSCAFKVRQTCESRIR